VAGLVVHWLLQPSSQSGPPSGPAPAVKARSSGPAPRAPDSAGPATLAATQAGRLPAPVMDPATTSVSGGPTLMIAGLDSADVSVRSIYAAGPAGVRQVGSLPSALHDAAAASNGSTAYLFGGGEPSRDTIWKVTPGGRATRAGTIPRPASDVAAAQIRGSFYVVGGYTGTTSLSTIVRWRPGGRATIVGRLPKALRYAAVAAVGNELVIAGGTNGTAASSDVYAFSASSGRVRRLGRLPAPLTHAAAGAIGGTVYLIGGRGALQGTQSRRILAVDAATGRVTPAGRLPHAISDAGAATIGASILVAGGRDAAGRVHDEVLSLRPG
jgi:hypothetical protein